MRLFTVLFLIFLSFQTNAQIECDCCNYYLLSDYKTWETYFTPSEIHKKNYSILNADYTYLDSNGISQTKPLAEFYFNRRGYIDECREYYDGLLNRSILFERRFNKRIKSTTSNYLDEFGDISLFMLEEYTEYSYSKNSVKTRAHFANKVFLDDSIQNYEVVKYNDDGLQIESFAQYHFENNGLDEPYHYEMRSEVQFADSGSFAIRNYYFNDTLGSREEISLNEFGLEKETKLIDLSYSPEIIQITSYEYNAEETCTHIKSSNNISDKIFTECADRGTFDLYFTYEGKLLKSVLYTYGTKEYKITFSYQ